MSEESGAGTGGRADRARVIVFGDIHGDLDTLARSLAERGLIRYEGNFEQLLAPLREHLSDTFIPALEALVIRQPVPTRLILIGDLVDRFPYGYHVLQFLDKIRWERFDIEVIRLLGNHDLMNLMFFSNPFEVHQLMSEAGRPKEEIMQYIGSMGLADSLHSFYDLHHDELVEAQLQFYREGKISFSDGPLTWTLTYPVDLSWLADTPVLHQADERRVPRVEPEPVIQTEDLAEFATGLLLHCGMEPGDPEMPLPTSLNALVQFVFDVLGKLMSRFGERNWWRVFLRDADRWFGYSPEINGFNAFVTELSENGAGRGGASGYRFLPIDWRLVSLVWRKHYGAHFRQTRVLHVEDRTLFTHGGISPLAMMDPLFFGSLYSPTADGFRDLSSLTQVDLGSFVARSNRLVAQVIENCLNDYTFSRMGGVELLDQMGSWRGSSEGLPEFGGPLWADFEFLKAHVEDGRHARLRRLYAGFVGATGIERIVCGHTVFVSWTDPDLRYQKIEALESIGLEYLCVDNGCSRAYRWHDPVPTGIEFDVSGRMLGEPPEGARAMEGDRSEQGGASDGTGGDRTGAGEEGEPPNGTGSGEGVETWAGEPGGHLPEEGEPGTDLEEGAGPEEGEERPGPEPQSASGVARR